MSYEFGVLSSLQLNNRLNATFHYPLHQRT